MLAFACDFRVARDDAVSGDIRAKKAIFSNQGVGLLLPRLIGQFRAMDLLMTRRVIDAAEAERYVLLARVWRPPPSDRTRRLSTNSITGPTRTYTA